MSKKWKNRLMIFLLPLIALTVTGISVWASKRVDKIEKEVQAETNLTYRNIYVLSDTDLIVPLTVSFPKKEFADDLTYVFSLLREDSPVMKQGFKPILAKNACINKVNIENKFADIDFCPEFTASYNSKNELRVLEAIVWTATQYDEINSISLSVDGTALTAMPVNNTPLPKVLNRTIGINNMGIVGGNLYHTTSVTIYYERAVNNQNVLIPITRKLPMESTVFETYVKEVFNPKSNLMGFHKPAYVKQLVPLEEPFIESNEVFIDLDACVLEDETSINKNLYNYLVLSFQTLNINKVNVSVNGEIVQVSGYDIAIEDITVNNLYYNEVKL